MFGEDVKVDAQGSGSGPGRVSEAGSRRVERRVLSVEAPCLRKYLGQTRQGGLDWPGQQPAHETADSHRDSR